MKTKILHEDSSILVIHKPAGIAVQSARIGQMDVESELRNYIAAGARTAFNHVGANAVLNASRNTKAGTVNPYIGLVHRLDQPVEGLLVVAKTKEAAAKLNQQLAAGFLNKKYLAVVCLEQDIVETTADITDYLLKDGQVAKIVSTNMKDAKIARLHYKLLQKSDNLALADIEIETGRFHQIRCQMAHHGMPLLGDVKYGSSASMEKSRELGIRQVALCANRIVFKHPATGKSMEFEVKPENIAFAKFL